MYVKLRQLILIISSLQPAIEADDHFPQMKQYFNPQESSSFFFLIFYISRTRGLMFPLKLVKVCISHRVAHEIIHGTVFIEVNTWLYTQIAYRFPHACLSGRKQKLVCSL